MSGEQSTRGHAATLSAYVRRFEGDMILIGSYAPAAMEFVRQYSQRSGYYMLSIEGTPFTTLHVMDIRVTKSGCRYVVSPEFKGNFLESSPLDIDSAHMPGVHMAWPRARMRSLSAEVVL